jgi:phosphopantothenoylcysteine decarboxylase/phosphopantothenate--cysteine ligase
MASLTIRKLDEQVKTYLRLRSARNRRSVEEEVRVILRELIEGREEPLTPFAVPPEASPAPALQRTGALPEASLTLIIGAARGERAVA